MKNKWFCIGQSGATVDGRQIEATVLQQIAETYNPETYGARINIEHFRPFWPNSELGGYGDVLELKAETQDGHTKLYARIDPTDKMLELLKKREKVYTSMEIAKNFAATGKAYLMGLALTDSPASTGTTMLKFSMQQHPQALISQQIEMKETTMKKENNPTENKKTGMFAALAALFSNPTPQHQEKDTPQQTEKDTEARLTHTETELQAAYTVIEKMGEAFADMKERLEHLEQKLNTLETTPTNPKAPHTGGSTEQAQSEF